MLHNLSSCRPLHLCLCMHFSREVYVISILYHILPKLALIIDFIRKNLHNLNKALVIQEANCGKGDKIGFSFHYEDPILQAYKYLIKLFVLKDYLNRSLRSLKEIKQEWNWFYQHRQQQYWYIEMMVLSLISIRDNSYINFLTLKCTHHYFSSWSNSLITLQDSMSVA